jgi:hypothetical protein
MRRAMNKNTWEVEEGARKKDFFHPLTTMVFGGASGCCEGA